MRAVLALIVLLAFAVAPGRALDGRQFRLHGGRLVDERRPVTFGDGRLPLEPIPVFDDGDAATMARFGLNLLRLPISWSGLEPVRGRFDAAYLDRIAGWWPSAARTASWCSSTSTRTPSPRRSARTGRRAGCSTSCSARRGRGRHGRGRQ